MNKHACTLVPTWAFRELLNCNVVVEGNRHVCTVGLTADDCLPDNADDCDALFAQAWRDGTLIAAAPEMLVALRGVLRVADRATVEFDAARAAIRKATGGL